MNLRNSLKLVKEISVEGAKQIEKEEVGAVYYFLNVLTLSDLYLYKMLTFDTFGCFFFQCQAINKETYGL